MNGAWPKKTPATGDSGVTFGSPEAVSALDVDAAAG